ncbi:hypothetical protein CKO15_04365 [Halorhodospira abdelmalekii]|uniref:helix-turn-helix transcriptional regulator n=1 Tax=Halorhodospira abdelmalekii TaxID=421629 RepID=UPI00190332A5|nr:helix-turn-helix transcriptional regulator [Halorhodospira abdelmalekii]MBK1734531.1 hypothetical protein [Halorhodospira abdelmalekii]
MEQRGRLLEAIYSAAIDPRAWERLLSEIVTAVAARSARLLIMDESASRVRSSFKFNIDDGDHQAYVDHYVNTCPWRPELRLKPPGRLYSTFLDFSCSQPDFYRCEFFNEWARPQDIHHGACGTLVQHAGYTVQLLVQRTCDQGHFSAAETALLSSLAPHLQTTFTSLLDLEHRAQLNRMIVSAVDQQQRPFVLFAEDGTIAYCSPSAATIVHNQPLLSTRGGRLYILDRTLDSRFQRALSDCLKWRSEGDAFALPAIAHNVRPLPARTAPQARLYVQLSALHPDIGHPLLGQRAFAAAYLYETTSAVNRLITTLQARYNLSSAEAVVAATFAREASLERVAEHCHITLHTVRSHIKAIYRKTDTRNQAELMQRLLCES